MKSQPGLRTVPASEYRAVQRGGKHALVHPDVEEGIAAALIEAEGCTPVPSAGRGGLQRAVTGAITVLIRPYRRGGVLARMLPRKFLLDNRAAREFEAHLHAASSGVRVPALAGVVWERRGPWFSGAIATLEIDGPHLQDWLDGAGAGANQVLRELGRNIRAMHDAGIWHADLQVRNVVVHEGLPWLIDFDRARVRTALGTWMRAANLLRLERSFRKNELPTSYMATILEGYGECHTPHLLRALYEARHAISDAISGRWFRPTASTFEIANGVALGAIRAALRPGGEELKRSRKWLTRRHGPWVVKQTAAGGIASALKRIVSPDYGRAAWRAASLLADADVRVPAPGAYVEWTRCGLSCGSAIVIEYLDGWVNVEEFARRVVNGDVPTPPGDFLHGLAQAVNRLNEHAYHADLSGKNIFTKSGSEFAFIDLDSVDTAPRKDDASRLKNLAQLLDSFCDYWDNSILDPFVETMLPPHAIAAEWNQNVKKAQRARRERQQAIWKRQGRSTTHPPASPPRIPPSS